jgi:hypothetical protein
MITIGDHADAAAVAFDKIAGLDGKFKDDRVQPLIDLVSAYNTLYEGTNKKLKNMGSLNSILSQVGSILSLNNDEIRIETDQIKVEIDINVTLDTRVIARALVEGEFVPGGPEMRARLDMPPKGKSQ